MTINPAYVQKLMELKAQVAASAQPPQEDAGMKVEFDASKMFNQVAAYCYYAISEYLKDFVLKEGYGYPEQRGWCIAPHAYERILKLAKNGQFNEDIYAIAEKVLMQIIEGIE